MINLQPLTIIQSQEYKVTISILHHNNKCLNNNNLTLSEQHQANLLSNNNRPLSNLTQWETWVAAWLVVSVVECSSKTLWEVWEWVVECSSKILWEAWEWVVCKEIKWVECKEVWVVMLTHLLVLVLVVEFNKTKWVVWATWMVWVVWALWVAWVVVPNPNHNSTMGTKLTQRCHHSLKINNKNQVALVIFNQEMVVNKKLAFSKMG